MKLFLKTALRWRYSKDVKSVVQSNFCWRLQALPWYEFVQISIRPVVTRGNLIHGCTTTGRFGQIEVDVWLNLERADGEVQKDGCLKWTRVPSWDGVRRRTDLETVAMQFLKEGIV